MSNETLIDVSEGTDRVLVFTSPLLSKALSADPASVYIDLSTNSANAQFGPLPPSIGRKLRELLKGAGNG